MMITGIICIAVLFWFIWFIEHDREKNFYRRLNEEKKKEKEQKKDKDERKKPFRWPPD